MSATAAQIARLRRMVAEPDASTYSDDDLAAYIEDYPLIDERGEEPYVWDTTTEPPTQDANESWIPTYDLNAAAAGIWEEKAAMLAQDFDFSADGAHFNRSQAYEQMMRSARYFRSRRPLRTVTQRPEPERSTGVLSIATLAEGDDG